MCGVAERTAWASLVCGSVLSGCATPAIKVEVPTMTVPEAWNASSRADFGNAAARITRGQGNRGLPYPVVSAPDIRMAYIKPWKDEFGNRHFGSWVAIQVDPPRWVLPDGTLDSIDSRGAASPPAEPRP